MYDPVRQTRRKIRPEEKRAVLLQPPRHKDSRKWLRGSEANVRIRFVVAQQDIELRLVLLDQIVLERQRLALIVNDDVFRFGDFAHQRTRLRIELPRLQKI